MWQCNSNAEENLFSKLMITQIWAVLVGKWDGFNVETAEFHFWKCAFAMATKWFGDSETKQKMKTNDKENGVNAFLFMRALIAYPNLCFE